MLRLTLCVALFSACVQAEDQRIACALLERVDGAVYWKADKSPAVRTLSPTKDAEMVLYSGETIRCGHGGDARIWMDGREIERAERDGPLIIRCGNEQPASASRKDDAAAAQQILEHYGRRAGRGRSISSVVFRPADGSTVEAKDFVISWAPRPDLKAASITIENSHGNVLWQQQNVSGAAGRLESGAAKQALGEYARQPLRRDLLLTMVFTSGERAGVHFSVLSEERQVSLERALQSLEASVSGFLLNIARAYVFDSYEMYNRTADEYEQALEARPGSRDLLLATVAAEQKIGNAERVASLQRILQGLGAERQ